ncbi:MAG: hypothetical protein K9W43_13705 [Candidatus Thorarchaeota archaeon]|nr:hypothetical protein [Candidatus Thorarchaeota archaeon]
MTFSYATHIDLCNHLLGVGTESAYRTVVNRTFLSAAMIIYQTIRETVGPIPRDHTFYDALEEKVFLITEDSELVEYLKELRYSRLDADYDPERSISHTKASDCIDTPIVLFKKYKDWCKIL